MIDVFMRRERHIYIGEPISAKALLSLRDFGPKSEDDLLD
jgi:hypothetical protein